MIRHFLDLSSQHLSIEAKAWLNERATGNFYCTNDGRWHVASHADGWWCRVPVDCAPEDFPRDLLLVCDRARTLGADYILFDHEAEELPDLPIYGR